MRCATLWDDLWLAQKLQSNSAIAGSPRNSFRASVGCLSQGVEHWMRAGRKIPSSIKLRILGNIIRQSDYER